MDLRHLLSLAEDHRKKLPEPIKILKLYTRSEVRDNQITIWLAVSNPGCWRMHVELTTRRLENCQIWLTLAFDGDLVGLNPGYRLTFDVDFNELERIERMRVQLHSCFPESVEYLVHMQREIQKAQRSHRSQLGQIANLARKLSSKSPNRQLRRGGSHT